MPRNHGRISTSIWDDADFIALAAGPQRMYMFLLSQPNLNYAGLLPLTMNRWARKYSGGNATAVRADLLALAEARFIVLDEDIEELTVRTLVKGDGVHRQPRVMQRFVEDAQEITSPKLRAALLVELGRLPLDDLSDKPVGGRDSRSVRQVAVDSIEAVREAYGDPLGNPSGNPPRNPSPDPSGRVPASHVERDIERPGAEASETPGNPSKETPNEGSREGSREGFSRARVHMRAGIPPSPYPLPPIPPTAGPAENGDAAGEPTAQTLISEWIDHCATRPPGRTISHVSRLLREMLGEGVPPPAVRAGLARWHSASVSDPNGKHPSLLPGFVHAAANNGTVYGPQNRPAGAQPQSKAEGWLTLDVHAGLAAMADRLNHAAEPPAPPELRALPGGAA